MARTYRKKEGRRKYTIYSADSGSTSAGGNSNGTNLEKAIRCVKSGKMSIRKACNKYNVSRGTLHNRVRGMHSSRPGHPTVFTTEKEKSLVTHIVTVSQWGFPFTTLDMRFLAKSYLDSAGRAVSCFKNNYPSTEWARSFLDRHKMTLTQRNLSKHKRSKIKCVTRCHK